MGYDCTLHVVDERAVREMFVPRLLKRPCGPTAFDAICEDVQEFFAGLVDELEKTQTDPDHGAAAAHALCQAALQFASAGWPHIAERGVAFSLWDRLHRDFKRSHLPLQVFGSPERMFQDLMAIYPNLGPWPTAFEGNFTTGVFIPAENVPAVRAWLDAALATIPPGQQKGFRGLRRVLLTAERMQLAYWEGTDLSVVQAHEEWLAPVERAPAVAAIEAWPYPTGYGNPIRCGRWLFIPLRERGATGVLDLEAWPPVVHPWRPGQLEAIEALPSGGWAVLSHEQGANLCGLWLHPPGRPGQATPERMHFAETEGDPLQGLVVLGDQVFAYSERVLYWLTRDKLKPVAKAKGVTEGRTTSYTHGVAHLAGGRRLLIWDGDGYELQTGKLRKTWTLGINEPHEFATAPYGADGFYYLQGRKVYRVRREADPERVMEDGDNVMRLAPGPEGTLLFSFGDNDAGHAVRAWFPETNKHTSLAEDDLAVEGEIDGVSEWYWSEATQCLYVPARSALITVPGQSIWSRPRQAVVAPPPVVEKVRFVDQLQHMSEADAVQALEEEEVCSPDVRDDGSVESITFYRRCDILPAELAVLSKFPRLEELSFGSGTATDEGLIHVGRVTSLRRLRIESGDVTGAGIAHLTGLVNLEELTLESVPLAGDDLAPLARLPKLRVLCELDAEALGPRSLAGLLALEELDARRVNDAMLANCGGLSRLTRLSVHGSITAAGLKPLVKLPLTAFRCPCLNSACLEPVGQFTRLVELGLSHADFAAGGLARLAPLQRLADLNLDYARLAAADLQHLAALPALRTLSLQGMTDKMPLTDQHLASLAKCTQLERLVLGNNPITDRGLQHLAGLVNLRELWLAGTQVSDAGIATLAGMSRLENLNLFGTRITDAALARLAKLPLTSLSVEQTQVSAAAARKFARAHPNCEMD